jgi:hypothetical protein
MIKKIGDNWYVHYTNIKELRQAVEKRGTDPSFSSRLNYWNFFNREVDADVIKYNIKTKDITLIESKNWWFANEPDVGKALKIDFNENTKIIQPRGQIYHHRHMFMANPLETKSPCELRVIGESQQRKKVIDKIPNIKNLKNKIGYKKFWENLLAENNISL